SDAVIEQINKQLNKLIDVAAVMDLSEGEHLERELMLVKVRADVAEREEFKQLMDTFQARAIEASDHICTLELTDTCARLDEFLRAIGRDLILETVRTGASGIGRGERILKL
ncbi:MAG: acetolactate synthase small subunit, partial [Gallionella sp.]